MQRTGSPAAIVVAGGSGRRAITGGDATPKQFRSLAGRALFEWSIDAFKAFGCSPIVVVVPESHVDVVRASWDGDAVVAAGGETRQRSVANGLVLVDREFVLIHDAARPLIDRETIERVVDALHEGAEAAIPTVPVSETIKEISDHVVLRTITRDHLHVSQTPQGFITEIVRRAHEEATKEGFVGTDDAQLVERSGGLVTIVTGSRTNIKVTTADDFDIAAAMMDGR
ncbi:MAG: 2-C-methyl-D-erythritol 4-phosphate cytidylyltransferase [Actinomycetota bacterium]|nr:2-C-methyl-D-erythritol 4-phosphate cytidylyltransferase [Actinomycetota bacterium]